MRFLMGTVLVVGILSSTVVFADEPPALEAPTERLAELEETLDSEIAAAERAQTEAPFRWELVRVPRGMPCGVPGGERYQCFTFEEYKQLIQLDIDWYYQQRVLELTESVLGEYRLAYAHQVVGLDAAAQAVAHLTNERSRLLSMWTEENRLRLAAENRPVLGSWVPWTAAALATAVATGLFVAHMVR